MATIKPLYLDTDAKVNKQAKTTDDLVMNSFTGSIASTSGTTKLSTGVEASKPGSPAEGQIYIANDTDKFFICFSTGIWTEIVRAAANVQSSTVSFSSEDYKDISFSSSTSDTNYIAGAFAEDGALVYFSVNSKTVNGFRLMASGTWSGTARWFAIDKSSFNYTLSEATYYIDPTSGSDTTGTGTNANPYKSFQYAVEQLPENINHIPWLRFKSADTSREEIIVAGKKFGKVKIAGTATGGSTTTIINTNETRDWDAILKFGERLSITMTSGLNSGLTRRITSYNESTDTFTTETFPNVNANTDTYEIQLVAFIGILGDTTVDEFRTGTATSDGAADGSTLIDSGASDFTSLVTNDYFLKCTSGTNNGYYRRITAFDNGTKTFTVEKFFNQIASGVTYEIQIVSPSRASYIIKGSVAAADTTQARNSGITVYSGQRVLTKGVSYSYQKCGGITVYNGGMGNVKGCLMSNCSEDGLRGFNGGYISAYNSKISSNSQYAINLSFNSMLGCVDQISCRNNNNGLSAVKNCSAYGEFIYVTSQIKNSSFSNNTVRGLLSWSNSTIEAYSCVISGNQYGTASYDGGMLYIYKCGVYTNTRYGITCGGNGITRMHTILVDGNGTSGTYSGIIVAADGMIYSIVDNKSINNTGYGIECNTHSAVIGISAFTDYTTGNVVGASYEDSTTYAKIC